MHRSRPRIFTRVQLRSWLILIGSFRTSERINCITRTSKMTLARNPSKTNHKECTHRYVNTLKLWNDSLAKFLSLFSERSLKYKINNRNLCYKLEGIHSRNSLLCGQSSSNLTSVVTSAAKSDYSRIFSSFWTAFFFENST